MEYRYPYIQTESKRNKTPHQITFVLAPEKCNANLVIPSNIVLLPVLLDPRRSRAGQKAPSKRNPRIMTKEKN
jgi:hypothetical protein